MKLITMILLCILWGIISTTIAPYPMSIVIAFIGGGLIGWIYPKLYDKLF